MGRYAPTAAGVPGPLGWKLTPHELRKAAGVAIRFARSRTLRNLALTLPEHPALPAPPSIRAIAEGAIVADFDIDFYRADRKDLSIQSLTVLTPEPITDAKIGLQIAPEFKPFGRLIPCFNPNSNRFGNASLSSFLL